MISISPNTTRNLKSGVSKNSVDLAVYGIDSGNLELKVNREKKIVWQYCTDA